jgi:hypothetical protein
MKKRLSIAITTFGLLMTMAVAQLHGQSRLRIAVHIPFDFVAGETRCSAGKYTIAQLTEKTILIRSTDGRTSVIMHAPQSASSGGGRLAERVVFRHYDDQYFLSQVWLTRTETGHALDTSNAEREWIKIRELSENNVRPQTVEVIALGR